MKISIRPAPHANPCALDKRKSGCGKFNNESHRCEKECPAGCCCEMKHCWQVGEALERELVARGHTVFMANKKYRLGAPQETAAQNTRLAMAELNAHKPDLHIAIHTNANGNASTRGVQAMYPPARYGERTERSKALCREIAAAIQGIYDGRTWTREYSAIETNTCPGAGCYLELGYGNTNVQDARFVHDHPQEIARAIADGMEAWWKSEGKPLPETPATGTPVSPEKEKTLEERVAALEAWRERFPA